MSHVGKTAGYRTFLARYPEQQVSIAILCNVSNVKQSQGRASGSGGLFLAGHLKEEKSPGVNISVQELQSKTGLYRNLDTDEVQHFFVKDRKLMVGFEEGKELMPTALNKFQTVDFPRRGYLRGRP